MAETMTPSEATREQIGKILDNLGAGMNKAGLPKEATQRVLETQGAKLTEELVAVVRKFVEAFAKMIVRIVEKVNRERSPQEALDATGRRKYTSREVVDAMPRGTGVGAKIKFFKLDLRNRGGHISDDDLEKEFEARGLVPEDSYSLATVNEADPAFADEHPNATHWKDSDGKWCYMAFSRYGGGRSVDVGRDGSVWYDNWWFAGRECQE